MGRWIWDSAFGELDLRRWIWRSGFRVAGVRRWIWGSCVWRSGFVEADLGRRIERDLGRGVWGDRVVNVGLRK